MTGTSAPDPDARDARARRPWLRGVLVAGLLTLLLVALIRGGHKDPEPQPEEEPDFLHGVEIPLPATPHKDLQEEARGMYVLEIRNGTFNLELQREGRFRFLSRLQGKELREATGTWNLVGSRLTMSYQQIDGKPVESPTVVRNVYTGTTIQLRETGLDFPVVLTKRTMLRER